MKSALTILLLVAVVVPVPLHGHGSEPIPAGGGNLWAFDPGTIIGLAFFGIVYWRGLRRMRRATGNARKLRRAAWAYAAGWWVLLAALVSPLHTWGKVFFSAHMVQHELLMVVAAPLLVMGQPAAVMLSALPPSNARRLVSALRKRGGDRLWSFALNPLAAWLVHAAALWLWHVPAFFEATLTHDGVHALQHLSFLGSALLFWHAVIRGPYRRRGYAMGFVFLFTTATHSGALGALLAFATTAWYPSYTLNDQQLGGLIMWIPAGLIYLGAALALFALWIRPPPLLRDLDPLSPSCV